MMAPKVIIRQTNGEVSGCWINGREVSVSSYVVEGSAWENPNVWICIPNAKVDVKDDGTIPAPAPGTTED